jgi:hypothetical protein
MSISSKVRVGGSFTLVGLCLLSSPLWSSGAWGQQIRTELAKPRMELARPRPGPIKLPKSFALQPVSPQPAAPTLTPVALPVTNPSSALGGALASCDQGSGGTEPLSLPGARGEVKLDRCYRGRDHLVCSFNALLAEARSLLDSYSRIVDANYPNVSNVEGVCSIKPNNLTIDLESAIDFTTRFKDLEAAYGARANCVSSLQQSFRDVTLPDMTQAPDILKSMIDAVEGDIKVVAGLQAQVVGLAVKIDASEKAILTIQKIHRTMCVRNQPAKVDAGNRENAVMPGPSIIPVEIKAPQPGASDAKFAPDPVFAALQPTPAPKANITPATTATSRAVPPRDVHDAILSDGPVSRGWKYLQQKAQDYLMWLQDLMGVKGTS